MSEFTCPCGFRAEGMAREAWTEYRKRDCPHHPAETVENNGAGGDGCGWAVVAFVAFLVFLSFVCTNGWGRFS